MLTMDSCCLCSQIEGRPDNDLIARLLPDEPYSRRIMLEGQSFAVLPSLGPLASGHSLLCPKRHLRSFAHVSPELYDEFSAIKPLLVRSLREVYGNDVHIFEHGMADSGNRVLCTVDHAHMHFLPLPRTFTAGEMLVAGDHGWTSFDGTLATLQRLCVDREYVLYETPDGVARLLTQPGPIESQYMRRFIAAGLGHGEHWNWRTAPDARAADDTWRRFVSSPLWP